MSLLDFFIKPNLDSLRNQGGMEKKYASLISLILNLSEDVDEYNRKQKYQTHNQLVKENHYIIKINLVREGMIFHNLDIFELIHKNDRLEIKFRRDTKNLLPFGPTILPDTLEEKWVFDNSLNQKAIFTKVISNIIEMFSSKYNFSDSTYKNKFEVLIKNQ